MSNSIEKVKRFKKEVSDFINCWNQVDIKTFFIKVNNINRNLITSINLEYERKPETKVYQPHLYTKHLKMYNAKLKIEELDSLLESISKGSMKIDDLIIQMDKTENTSNLPWSFDEYEIGFKSYLKRYHYNTFVLDARGHDSIQDICKLAGIRSINWELRNCSFPYIDIDDFVKENFDYDGDEKFREGYSSYVEINAPLKMYFTDECFFGGNKLHIELVAEMPTVSKKASIQYIATSFDGSLERRNFSVDPRSWQDNDGIYRYIKNYHLINSQHVHTYCHYGDKPIGIGYFENTKRPVRNSRMILHMTIDQELKLIQEQIHDKSSNRSNKFESAISWLLHLCGFAVINYGSIAKSTNFVDLVAFSSYENIIFVIECTTDLPDTKNKLSKLHKRAKELEKELPDVTLIPILFSQLERKVISPAEIRKAHDNDIGVFTIDDFTKLIEICTCDQPEDKVMEFLKPGIL